MKASELIQRLEELKKEYGDLEVVTYDVPVAIEADLESVVTVTHHNDQILIDCC